MRLYMIFGVFGLFAAIQSAAVKQDTGIVAASVGESVTLNCSYDSQVAMHFSWYRQTLGREPELLTTIYKHDNPSKLYNWMETNPRISVQRKEGMNNLRISDVHLSDSAMYFCGSSHSNVVEFGKGVFLSVKGASTKKIIQMPASENIMAGNSVTLNCTVYTATCSEKPHVYWFRHGFPQGILYTVEGQWNHTSSPVSSSQSCVYHLQKLNLSSSDSGIYYCAVASCGEILFGNGSRLLVEGAFRDQVAQMRIFVWLSISRSGTLLFFVTICLFVYAHKRK